MRIVSSEILEAIQQQDGRIGVTEKHTLDDGNTMLHSYIADADFVLQEVAEARAAKINAVFDLSLQRALIPG